MWLQLLLWHFRYSIFPFFNGSIKKKDIFIRKHVNMPHVTPVLCVDNGNDNGSKYVCTVSDDFTRWQCSGIYLKIVMKGGQVMRKVTYTVIFSNSCHNLSSNFNLGHKHIGSIFERSFQQVAIWYFTNWYCTVHATFCYFTILCNLVALQSFFPQDLCKCALCWVACKRCSLANCKNGFSTKNTYRRVDLPTFTEKFLGCHFIWKWT